MLLFFLPLPFFNFQPRAVLTSQYFSGSVDFQVDYAVNCMFLFKNNSTFKKQLFDIISCVWPSETVWRSAQSQCLQVCPMCWASGTTCPAPCPMTSRSTNSMMWRPSMGCYRWEYREVRLLDVGLQLSITFTIDFISEYSHFMSWNQFIFGILD